ncbi:hypothetical protein Vretimale_466 [Volvox reticuliferus]|uniref:Uncharacterized protein n=1 Tax=Volvox reticuliferus TaxID=1737510 RepID=A0A8J4D2N1_9CHLO|nr:hypothetical protein Vretimale_466 [Volvox reticuliferus]
MLSHWGTFKKVARYGRAIADRPRSRLALRVHARSGGGCGNVLDRPDLDLSKRLGGFDLSDFNTVRWIPITESGFLLHTTGNVWPSRRTTSGRLQIVHEL